MKDSPVNSFLTALIQFDKSSNTAVYIQIAQQIINAIQRGYLNAGTALPGTRTFKELFQIHRNTAVAVYDELASQGWVEIIANKGTFILDPKPKKTALKAQSNKIGDVHRYPKNTGFPFETSFLLSSTNEYSEAKYS